MSKILNATMLHQIQQGHVCSSSICILVAAARTELTLSIFLICLVALKTSKSVQNKCQGCETTTSATKIQTRLDKWEKLIQDLFLSSAGRWKSIGTKVQFFNIVPNGEFFGLKTSAIILIWLSFITNHHFCHSSTVKRAVRRLLWF